MTPQKLAEQQRQQDALNEWEREDVIRKAAQEDKVPVRLIFLAIFVAFSLGVISAMFYVAFVEYPNYQRAYETIQHK